VTSRRLRTSTIWPTLIFLIMVVLVYAGVRVATDWPNVAAGTIPPDESPDYGYALHPILAYAHILPGVIYLLGAPFQLSRRFRQRHFTVHRRMGRVVLPAGIMAGVFAIVFASRFSFGGLPETIATVVFGGYFVIALVTAFLAIKRGDVARHRQWMIRAFAVGLAVGTIRVWIALFQVFGWMSLPDSFGLAFWLGFVAHAVAAEAYLVIRPGPGGAAQPALA